MSTKRLFVAVLFLSVLFVSSLSLKNQLPLKPKILGTTNESPHPIFEFQEDIFFQGINASRNSPYPVDDPITSLIIPHHSLASHLIAKPIQLISSQNPRNIIILGPNHKDSSSTNITSSKLSWDSPFGILETNKDLINKLEESNLVSIEDSALSDEQSIAALVPYIKYLLPHTTITPIIFNSSTTHEQSQQLANFLTQAVTSDDVIISSLDFSHYLNLHQAQEKDQITLSLIQEFQTLPLFKLNSDYLDSPASLATLLHFTSNSSATNLNILDYSNSGELSNDLSNPTTSYFVVSFTKPK